MFCGVMGDSCFAERLFLEVVYFLCLKLPLHNYIIIHKTHFSPTAYYYASVFIVMFKIAYILLIILLIKNTHIYPNASLIVVFSGNT